MGAGSIQPIRGFQDLLPPESDHASALKTHARDVFALYGFGEIRLPTLEFHELFVKSTGETTDIVEKEMFRLQDQGGRDLALRPEGTPGVVRAYLSRHLAQKGPVAKLFYIGSMFRAERPQKGRYREFEQIGVETIGNPHPMADADCILALQALYDRIGLRGKTKLKLNNLGCESSPDCRPRYRERLRAFLKEREGQLCDNCRRRIDRNPLRALDCKGDAPALKADAPKLEPCKDCREHVDQVEAILKDCGCAPARDTELVRGLDYYTRTVFEFTADGIGSQDALAGGGRYDGLVESMGGPSTPAVGWALGLERTLLAVEAAEPGRESLMSAVRTGQAEFFVIAASSTGAPLREAARFIQRLRQAGRSARGGLFASSLKAQMKEASRQGADYAVIIGEDEIRKRVYALRDMSSGTQTYKPMDSLP